MIRTMLADDEEPARHRLRSMLGEFNNVRIVAEAEDGMDALEKAAVHRPDLLFLDIEMPGMTGMQVASALPPPRPRIVFCTAFDRYAIDAFELHATDYLLKPVSRERLSEAIRRIRGLFEGNDLLQREVATAESTQARLFPQTLPVMSTLDYAGACLPARGVSGDYYDFIDLGKNRLSLVLGDISGKGIFAALLMAKLQATIQSGTALQGDAIDELLADANRRMYAATDSNRYATLFYGLFDGMTRTLRYVNAGHPPPFLMRANPVSGTVSSVLRLQPSGTAIGLISQAEYTPHRLAMTPGDVLLAFSDGLSEAHDAGGEQFGEARLGQALRRHRDLRAAELCQVILREVAEFTGGASGQDDMTLVAAKVR